MDYTLSRYASILHFPSVTIVAHGPRLVRLALSPDLHPLIRLFATRPLGAQAFSRFFDNEEDGEKMFELLARNRIIVPVGADEEAMLRDDLNVNAIVESDDSRIEIDTPYRTLSLVRTPGGGRAPSRGPLRVALIGGCVADFLVEELNNALLEQGYEPHVVFQFFDFDVFPRIHESFKPALADMVVFQPTTNLLLKPLWDDGAFVSPDRRRTMLQLARDQLAAGLNALENALKGDCLGLVHNIAPPQVSPFGRADFRHEVNFREIVSELNLFIESKVRHNPNIILVDEERISYRLGSSRLWDDLYFPFSHHGGSLDPAVKSPHQLPAISRAFVSEYLACLRMWKGTTRIKCIACDLDNTLWKGLAAEDGINMSSDETPDWIHRGLNQALALMKSRGVLLATVSKNDESVVLGVWEKSRDAHLLRPEDFVLHLINWEPKSRNLRLLAQKLNIGLDSILFLDDNPVERAEVAQALPEIRIAQGEVSSFRAALLLEPDLDVNIQTDEGRRRSEMVRAQIAREELREHSAGDDTSFLRSLEIRLQIRSLHPGDEALPRVIELIQRTNQFNTTLLRLSAGAVDEKLAAGGSLHALWVKDRFTDYGLVAACLVEGQEVSLFVMSCRVIGLSVAVPFLAHSLLDSGALDRGPVLGRVVDGPRNSPARDLFLRAGFEASGEGTFRLREPSHLPRIDSAIYRILTLEQESSAR